MLLSLTWLKCGQLQCIIVASGSSVMQYVCHGTREILWQKNKHFKFDKNINYMEKGHDFFKYFDIGNICFL